MGTSSAPAMPPNLHKPVSHADFQRITQLQSAGTSA
jgi:hypothetical protein